MDHGQDLVYRSILLIRPRRCRSFYCKGNILFLLESYTDHPCPSDLKPSLPYLYLCRCLRRQNKCRCITTPIIRVLATHGGHERNRLPLVLEIFCHRLCNNEPSGGDNQFQITTWNRCEKIVHCQLDVPRISLLVFTIDMTR